jgi:hypothetical protein
VRCGRETCKARELAHQILQHLHLGDDRARARQAGRRRPGPAAPASRGPSEVGGGGRCAASPVSRTERGPAPGRRPESRPPSALPRAPWRCRRRVSATSVSRSRCLSWPCRPRAR